MTRSTSASPIVRGAPGRGSSSSPSRRPARNRRRHLPTVGSVIKSVAAMALFERPSAAPRMIRARRARAWAVVGRRVQRVSVARSSAVNVSSLRGRPLGMASSRFVRPREMPLLCHTLLTQDTSGVRIHPGGSRGAALLEPWGAVSWSPAILARLLVLGVLGTGLAYVAWFWLLDRG